MAASPRRVVLDTNACLDLFVFDDPACKALGAAIRGRRVEAVTDAACRAEWLRVLGYPALRLGGEARAAAEAAFDAVLSMAPPDGRPADVVLPRCRDPDDQKFLELAARCGASVLVTRDASLLRLSRRTQSVAGFAVLPPTAVVAALDATLASGAGGAAAGSPG